MNSDELDEPRKGSPLGQLIAEDLDTLSVDELHLRIRTLKAEIDRAEARIAFSASHRASADELFRK